MLTGAATITVFKFLKGSKTELPNGPAIPLLRVYPKKSKTLRKGIHAPLSSLQRHSQQLRYGSSPSAYAVVHIYSELLLNHKKRM